MEHKPAPALKTVRKPEEKESRRDAFKPGPLMKPEKFKPGPLMR